MSFGGRKCGPPITGFHIYQTGVEGCHHFSQDQITWPQGDLRGSLFTWIRTIPRWSLLPCYISWLVWKYRKSLLFDNKIPCYSGLINSILIVDKLSKEALSMPKGKIFYEEHVLGNIVDVGSFDIF